MSNSFQRPTTSRNQICDGTLSSQSLAGWWVKEVDMKMWWGNLYREYDGVSCTNVDHFPILCNNMQSHLWSDIIFTVYCARMSEMEKRGHHPVKMRLRDWYREYARVGYTNITQFSMSYNNMKSPSWSDRYFRHWTKICNIPRVVSVVWKVEIAWATRTNQFAVMTCFE